MSRGGEEIMGGSSKASEFASLALPELVQLALAEDVSDDRAWELENEIGRRGLDEAMPVAQQLVGAEAPSARELGAGVLRALASSRVEEERAAAARLLLRVIEAESDPGVLVTTIAGCRHAAEERALEPLVRLSEHTDEDVRWAVAAALPWIMPDELDDRGVKTLIKLTADPDEDVRDWATFGIGIRPKLDSPDIRRALQERREDESFAVRCEALEGLGIRGDIEALAEALRLCDAGIEAVMVAEKAAAPELYEPLLARKSRGWAGDIADLDQAITACRPDEAGDVS